MNRGIARRTMFENRADIRFFTARLVREVRRKSIEIHAFSILTTHFHLLVRSIDGRLSDAMRRVQNSYTRRFNRSRRRDGPLVKGRFLSRTVDCNAYRALLVTYIDNNATQAGLVEDPSHYPHGSAWWYSRDSKPRWLERRWIERVVCRVLDLPKYDGSAYHRVFGGAKQDGCSYLVERRLKGRGLGDPLADLLTAAPDEVLAWMRRKAELADGTQIGIPVAEPTMVIEVVHRLRATDPFWEVRPSKLPRDGWLVLLSGLLRDLAGASSTETAVHLGRSISAISNLYRDHAQLLRSDTIYADRAAWIGRGILTEVAGGIAGHGEEDCDEA